MSCPEALEDAHVNVVELEGQEVEIQSEPASKRRYRPLIDKTPDEYRRHREKNNEAVKRCRERSHRRNRERDAEIDELREERAHCAARIEQMEEDNREMQDNLLRSQEECAALKAELGVMQETCSTLRGILAEHGIPFSLGKSHGCYSTSSSSLTVTENNYVTRPYSSNQFNSSRIPMGPCSTESTSSSSGIGEMSPPPLVAADSMMGVAEVVNLRSKAPALKPGFHQMT